MSRSGPLFACALAACLAAGCGRSDQRDQPGPDSNVIARAFRGVEVTRPELEEAVQLCLATRAQGTPAVTQDDLNALSQRVAESMLAERLLLAEVPGGDKTLETEADLRLTELSALFGGSTNLLANLEPLGWNEARLRAGIRSALKLRKLLGSRLPQLPPPTPEAITKFYAENAALFYQRPKAQVRHLLRAVPPDATPATRDAQRAACEEARRRILAGEPFEAVARELSEDPGTAPNGGDLGLVALGVLVPEFERVAASTPVGQISPVFETRFGWHVLVVTGLSPARVVSLADARPVIERILLDRDALQAVRTHVTRYLQENGGEFFLTRDR